ncbi:MAG: thioredoxin-dependent thiol peroxidase [Bacteroidia bacterium]
MTIKLNIGDKAPNFSCKNEKGELVSLKDFKGKNLVLYFYPKDDTPGCTAEACDLRDNYQSFLSKGFEILGVSPDSEKKHQKFIDKHELPFSLLADEDHSVAEAYGVWGEKSMYGRKYMGILRTTFVIDGKGKLSNIIEKVDTKAHSKQLI